MLTIREPTLKALEDVLTDRKPVTFRYGSNKRTVVVEPEHAEAIVKSWRKADIVGRRKIERMVSNSDTDFARCRDHAMGVEREVVRELVSAEDARHALSERFRVR